MMKNIRKFIYSGYGAYKIEEFVDTVLKTKIDYLNDSEKKELLNLLGCFLMSQPAYNKDMLEQIEKIFNLLDK